MTGAGRQGVGLAQYNRTKLKGETMPTLHVDDAIEHLVGYLRDEIAPTPRTPRIAGGTKYGCDLWLPIAVADYWQSRGHATFTADPRQPQAAAYYRPFCDAAWELCRIGVLRPGQSAPMGNQPLGTEFRGDGFSLTEFGRGWVQTAASIRRVTRVASARCCNHSAVALGKALPNARSRRHAAIERRITWPVA